MSHRGIGRLHVITDVTLQSRYTHAALASMAIAGGADLVQFRSKEPNFRLQLHEAEKVARICRERGATFIVNDRVDLAIAVGADGVHLGRSDMPVAVARHILGPEALIGATARSTEDVRNAESEGADYVGLGPIYSTGTKRVDHPPLGTETVREIVRHSNLPIIAIAGITIDNVADVLSCGVWGVAVIGAVVLADDPEAATRRLVSGMRRGFVAPSGEWPRTLNAR